MIQMHTWIFQSLSNMKIDGLHLMSEWSSKVRKTFQKLEIIIWNIRDLPFSIDPQGIISWNILLVIIWHMKVSGGFPLKYFVVWIFHISFIKREKKEKSFDVSINYVFHMKLIFNYSFLFLFQFRLLFLIVVGFYHHSNIEHE